MQRDTRWDDNVFYIKISLYSGIKIITLFKKNTHAQMYHYEKTVNSYFVAPDEGQLVSIFMIIFKFLGIHRNNLKVI